MSQRGETFSVKASKLILVILLAAPAAILADGVFVEKMDNGFDFHVKNALKKRRILVGEDKEKADLLISGFAKPDVEEASDGSSVEPVRRIYMCNAFLEVVDHAGSEIYAKELHGNSYWGLCGKQEFAADAMVGDFVRKIRKKNKQLYRKISRRSKEVARTEGKGVFVEKMESVGFDSFLKRSLKRKQALVVEDKEKAAMIIKGYYRVSRPELTTGLGATKEELRCDYLLVAENQMGEEVYFEDVRDSHYIFCDSLSIRAKSYAGDILKRLRKKYPQLYDKIVNQPKER